MNSETNDYILLKRTQIDNYFHTPLYIFNSDSGFVLFKPENRAFNIDKFYEHQEPYLYIKKTDKENAVKELQVSLKRKLINNINSGKLDNVKEAMCEIVNETLCNNFDESIETLPDTIDIIYDGYSKPSDLLKKFSNINYSGYPLANHSVNVMTMTMLYCLNNQISEKETKRISLLALLHDVGLTQLPSDVISTSNRLSDEQFEVYKTHAAIGHDIIKLNENIDSSLACGILEHHERIDGSGYPRGIANLSFEGRLIGLIDSFDSLTNTEKLNRKKKRPFDAMLIIKEEVITKGRFDKTIYKDLCLSLGKH